MRYPMQVLVVCVSVLTLVQLSAAKEVDSETIQGQLAIGLSHLYRRFLHYADPDQIFLQDAADVQWRDGMMRNQGFQSSEMVTMDGAERHAYSSIQTIIVPEQMGSDGIGHWFQNNQSEFMMIHNHGGAMQVNMLTESGEYSKMKLGNPLHDKGAQLAVSIPRGVYAHYNSLSSEKFSFLTLVAIPGWLESANSHFTVQEMSEKFPDHAKMFKQLATPSTLDDDHHDGDDDDDDDDDDDCPHRHRHRHRHGRKGRRHH